MGDSERFAEEEKLLAELQQLRTRLDLSDADLAIRALDFVLDPDTGNVEGFVNLLRDEAGGLDDERVGDAHQAVKMKPIPNYGDHMPLAEFVAGAACNALTNDDGGGNFATETEMSNLSATPSDIVAGIVPPPWATHVVWFNK